jgi:TP901 family phage tail tape measure protein
MAEDLSIKVKVEPDVSDLSNKLKAAGNGVAPIPVKISLANIGDIKNKIATLGTTVDVGVNVKLNNTVDLNSIASNLDGKDIELSSKLKLDASDIQKELNRIGKTLKLNLKVNDDSGLIDKLEKSSNAVRESANKIQQAMNIKLKDGFKVTEKTVTSLSSGLEKIRLNIGKIKDTSAKNRLQKDYDALKSNFNTMLTGREISVLDFSGIQSGLTRLTEQCGDVLSAEKTVSDEATTMKKSLENALSGIKDKFSQTDYKGLGGDEAIKAIKQKFNQQITAANTAIGEYNNDPTATKYEAANKALQALVSTQNELNSTINTTVGESDKLLKRFEAVDNTATSIQTRFAGVDFGRFADVTSVKTASEDYTKKLEAVDAARTALNKNFSSENVDAYDAAVKALGDSLNDLVQKLTKARSALSGFDNIERRYNTAMKKNTTAQNAGYASLMNPESLTNLESAWAAAKKAREAFEADMSTSNLKAYDDAIYELDQSLQAFSSNVNKAKGSSDKAFDALPGKITALGKQMQTLQESTPETDEVKAVLAMYEAVYKRLVQINDVSKNTGVRNYEELNSAFKDFEYVGTNVNSTISSLDDLMKVLSANARSATHSVREFNAEAKKTRNTNTYEKSMQNTMYTAQRYFNNNSKISTNTEAYTRFVDFFNTYDEKIKSKMFTQENSNQMSKDWSELKKYIQDAGLETDKLSVKLKKLFEVNIKSQLANQVINAFQQGLRQVYQNVVDIDSAMTELKKVTDETSGAYSKFLSEAGDRAKAVGSTVSDIVNATADYARLGYSLDDAKTLADVSAVYYNVGDNLDSFTTATDNIVGTMKAFNLEADDAIGLVDKLNAVSNNFAVSSGDLGNILQRSASAMEAAGNTLDQTIALGTAMNSVLQSADTTGTTLKVLALRLRGASTELASMGEETDGVATSTSKLRAQIAALTNVDGSGGFDILTDSGAFKSTYDIIQGIAKVYDRMSDVDQASLLELIAGKNRANGVAALLKQASQAEDVLQTSLNSSGKQNCLYVQKCA